MPSLLRYRPIIHTVGQKYCLDPAVITGVLSRQSHDSNVLANVDGGLCAYTGGAGYIRSSQDLSCDFCNDVLAQAKYFKRQGF
ncbi:hypothetical protein MG293_003367 [Ovis ammon polii]|uniref:Lysozyme n=1 Tax=Ovis ammon polii TaxID=230172 RepID=A0AAD4UHT8_OVIAM|nr:hypothetical protein MG293_003367 [Ovis ammon polii]KAI4577004.1 hypothetical protein MJT46_002839 [Ovis ammon polii x Ovis aries]